MIAYISEIGLLNNDDIYISDLFENPFLTYIAQTSWDDLEKIINAGINIKGKDLVKLRLDLQNNVHSLLTAENPEDYKNAYKEIVDKGYTFNNNIGQIMEKSQTLEDENSNMKIKIQEYVKQIEKLKKELSKNRYLDRVYKSKKIK